MGWIIRLLHTLKGNHKDSNGYWRDKFNRLIHRKIAYKKIYLKKKDDYPLPFSYYVIHHQDLNKENNQKTNLKILTVLEHNCIHGGEMSKKLAIRELNSMNDYINHKENINFYKV